MTLLATNISEPFLELLHSDKAGVDAVEVGPWFRPAQIRAYRALFPVLPFYFHAADLILGIEVIPGTLAKIQKYLDVTSSPWVSVHISMVLPGEVRRMKRGHHPPAPDPERASRRFVRQVRRLVRSVHVPVLLENNEPLPCDGWDCAARPDWITRLLTETDCPLLLDTGHARVAAARFGMNVFDYVKALPLERTMQIHVSGPRLKDGHLVDAHEPLTENDYALLEFLLPVTHPQVVTLEYIRETENLKEQLTRLRKMI